MELGNVKETKNIIEDIILGSIAEELSIEPGDVLISINGEKIKDVIDYKYLVSDDLLMIEIQKPNGDIWEFEVEKDYNEDLGIIFTNPLIDKAKTCKNKCMFCFIDQLPPNMRETLYFKDDDSRLSFLQGNFITLTNMSDEEIDRIIKYRLSPINVSVHTTNPELRVRMLNNKNAGKVYEILKRFHEANLEVNCQIVLVPGVNDGDELKRTVEDLSLLYPTIESVAVVPIGITKYRENLEQVIPYNKELSQKLLDDIGVMQDEFLESKGSRFIFPSDEFYCLSKSILPSFDDYEGFPQYENGVGLMKSFEYELENQLEGLVVNKEIKKKYIIATGTLAYEFIVDITNKINKIFKGIEFTVVPIKNRFFGETITVAGLVTGSDLINQIKDLGIGGNCEAISPHHCNETRYKDYDAIIIPKAMLKRNEEIFLDNIAIKDIEKELEIQVLVSEVDGEKFLDVIRLGVSK